MNRDKATSTGAPDASAVVDGPVGSAWLKDPATSGPTGANLEALPELDVGPGDQTDGSESIDGNLDLDRPRTRKAAPSARS